jgi:hypothetical protein
MPDNSMVVEKAGLTLAAAKKIVAAAEAGSAETYLAGGYCGCR